MGIVAIMKHYVALERIVPKCILVLSLRKVYDLVGGAWFGAG